MTTQSTTHTHARGATTWQMTVMALRYLGGRKLRTTLTTLAIVFGVALIFSVNLVLPGMRELFNQSMTTVTGTDVSITNVAGGTFDPAPVMDVVDRNEDVQAAVGLLYRQFVLPDDKSDVLGDLSQIQIVGVDPALVDGVYHFVMSEGRFLEPGESGSVIISSSVTDLAPQLQVGSTFSLTTVGGLKTFTVVGMYTPESPLAVPQFIVSLSDAQAALDQLGMINTVEVLLKPGADHDAVTKELQQALGDSYTLDDRAATSALPSIDVGFAMMSLFAALALFLGAFLIFNTFRTVVLERRRDLGMLRAIGATRQQITQTILVEGLIQGILGTLIGMVLGYLLAAALLSGIQSLADYVTFVGDMKLSFNVTAFAVPLIVGPLVALVASYWPARAAGRMSPLEALRPVPAAGLRHAARWSLIAGGLCVAVAIVLMLTGSKGATFGAVLFMGGMVIAAPGLVLPASRLFGPLVTLWFNREGDLAQGNVARQPGRAAITGSTLMIGVASIVMVAAMVSAFMDLGQDLTDGTFASDIMILPQSIAVYDNVLGADQSLAGDIQALPDVETVSTLRAAATTTDGAPLSLLGIDLSTFRDVETLMFEEGNADDAFAALSAGRGAIVTPLGASTLGLKYGDDFVIETAEGPQTYKVVALAQDLLTFKTTTALISQENMAADFHKSEDVLLMINLTPGADKDAALSEVESLLAGYPQFTAHLSKDYAETMMETTRSATVMFYIIAALILIPAGLGLLNTLTINVLERTREIGMIRAVGGSRSQVRRMVTGEALLLGIFGAAMGVLTGVAISYGFIAAFSFIGWDMPYTFPVAGIIAALIIGILLALSAGIMPARSAAKLDIIRALQYE
ncbi:ABC transporter permease [Aggregatilinea lenta]|uniref:ABC transporter permease n=1 Tax=Aggregatilinea lenta TaxID=913108 RepID=UPI000E5C4CD0|nr:FtsX-like permease family protein [Aggregatilinea lenta]